MDYPLVGIGIEAARRDGTVSRGSCCVAVPWDQPHCDTVRRWLGYQNTGRFGCRRRRAERLIRADGPEQRRAASGNGPVSGQFRQSSGANAHPHVKVNYDSGNSASLGYRPFEEFAAYGRRVGSVHLKDRRLGAGTVPLGSGDTDFTAVFESLKAVRYSGDFILQAARGETEGELELARKNVRVARQMIQCLRAP